MEVSVRDTDNRIMQYGQGIGDLDGCDTIEIDDALLDTLQQPGIKTLEADGSISVTPDLAAQAAEQARLDAIAAAEAQRIQDAQLVMSAFPTASNEAKAALARILGITLT